MANFSPISVQIYEKISNFKGLNLAKKLSTRPVLARQPESDLTRPAVSAYFWSQVVGLLLIDRRFKDA